MININDPKDCCGCTACASICTHDAITMIPDILGFLYPKINLSKCVDCGLCDKVCTFNNDYDCSLNLPHPEAYGARHKNMREVETSRSGAAFIAISDQILIQGGVVYGAGYTDHFRVVHKRATNIKERDEFKGSKYVQSDLMGVFRQIKRDLKDGIKVLFTGTPCQTAGLRSYINKNLHENLYLVDIICHGVPSPYIWRDYLSYLEKKNGSPIIQVNFRDKQHYGWRNHHETFIFERDGKKWDNKEMWYTKIFYQNLIFRHSCSNCHFCNTKRPSDLTLADFWGWEKTNPEINKDDKGISLILLNTAKGRKLWKSAQKDLFFFPAKLEDCIQTRMQFATPQHKKRNKFEQDYLNKGFEYIYKKDYNQLNIFSRIFNKIKKH